MSDMGDALAAWERLKQQAAEERAEAEKNKKLLKQIREFIDAEGPGNRTSFSLIYDLRKLTGWREPERKTCHYCGTGVWNGHEYNSETQRWDGNRHWLSDCRPDLTEHEPGPLCTWPADVPGDPNSCYAFQDTGTLEWGSEHKHFYPDGPMG